MIILWIILTILCVIYGILIASLHSGGLFFIFWFLLAAVFAIFALASYFHWWSLMPKVLKRIFIFCVIAGCAFFLAIEGLIISGFREKGPKGLDYIIVLGAQVHEYGPSVVLKYRLDTAIDYLNENPDTVCIVSGAQGINEPFTEAEGMARYLEQMGISRERILREDRAENTTGNIKYSMEIIEEREKGQVTLGIVTNNFHMFRSMHIAKAYMEKEQVGNVSVSGLSSPSKLLYLPNNMTREFFGVVKDFMLGNMK